MDAAYLEATVSAALVQALAATVEFQPEDSVDFLGKYLLKYAAVEEAKQAEKAATIEREIAAKEASAKASQAAAAAAEAASKASASSRADEGLAARVEAAHALNQELYTQILDHIKQVTGATGSYIAVKESAAGGGDEEEPKASLTFIAASANHGQLIGKKVTQPRGALFSVWVRPPAPEEEEQVDEEGNPIPRPPPPELPPLYIPNVLKNDAVEWFGVPRLGALLAVPFEYKSLSHPNAIPPPPEEGSEAAAAGGIPAGVPLLTSAAIVIDSVGQNRHFSPADVTLLKSWAGRLSTALNRLEEAGYAALYERVQEEKRKAAAEAAAGAGGDEKKDEE